MQIGEMIAVPEVFISEDHSTETCPWHREAEPDTTELAPQEEDDDKESGPINGGTKRKGMAKNDGGKLGDNMIDEGTEPLEAEIELFFCPAGEIRYQQKKRGKVREKTMVFYRRSLTAESFGSLKYAAHHTIPGNASLKVSALFPFLGDKDVIGGWKGKPSKIEDGKGGCGYDVNCAENGVWLPSPYALSMTDGNSPAVWPSKAGLKVLKKRRGANSYELCESFKEAYARDAVEKSQNRQFHMVHADYNTAVKNVLKAVKVKMMKCPEVSSSSDKFDPPMGLAARLNVLSSRMRSLLTGTVWHEPYLADSELNKAIAKPVEVAYAIADDEKVV